MRLSQALICFGLCVLLAATLGAFYVVFAIGAAMLAIGSGLQIAAAIGAGLAWPVMAFAYVLYTTRNMARRADEDIGATSRRAAETAARAASATGESFAASDARSARVVDPQKRKGRDQK